MPVVELILNQETVQVSRADDETLLTLLRRRLGLGGTKESCGEGTCGACLVLMGRRDEKKTVYKTVPACCISPEAAEGAHLVTIEGLSGETLSVIQEALVRHGAVQCGYCAPGLVISLTAFALSRNHSPRSARTAIDGNLCRCTGYKAIERAALELSERLKTEGSSPETLVRSGWLPPWFPKIAARLPITLKSSAVRALAGRIVIEAAVTLEALCESPLIRDHQPLIAEILEREVPQPKRNVTTLAEWLTHPREGGSLTAVFLICGSLLELERGQRVTASLLEEHLEQGGSSTDEIKRISFPIPDPREQCYLETVSRRPAPDPSIFASVLLLRSHDRTIDRAAIAIHGFERKPRLLNRSARKLIGRQVTPETVEEVIEEIEDEVQPRDTENGSSQYKRIMLRQMMTAHFRELFPRFPEADL